MTVGEPNIERHNSYLPFSIVIPTYNAGPLFKHVVDSILRSSQRPEKVLVIDSSSIDATAQIAIDAGFELMSIPQTEFDHGGTRNLALSNVNTEVVLFMTQDAILQHENTLLRLLVSFENTQVTAAYGRQLPHLNAKPLGAFARLHNYPEDGYLTSLESSRPKGIQKIFMSNSFAAYRYSSLQAVGGFPEKLILGEDSYLAGKLLLAGGKIEYVSEACVQHSHNYSLTEEFKRYFDIGVFHREQHWLLETFGTPEKMGFQFAIKQTHFLIRHKRAYLIPYSGLSLVAKYLGYRLGRSYRSLPHNVNVLCSMHKKYWHNKSTSKPSN